jgi:hypothetical protein
MVSTSTGAGSENTTAPDATASHTSPSATLWAALRAIADGQAGGARASAVMWASPQ